MKFEIQKLVELKNSIGNYIPQGANLLLIDTKKALYILNDIKKNGDYPFHFKETIKEIENKANYLYDNINNFEMLKQNSKDNFNSIRDRIYKLIEEAISYLN